MSAVGYEQMAFEIFAPAEPELPRFVPPATPDPFGDLCHRAFHGKVQAQDDRGRPVCARCGRRA